MPTGKKYIENSFISILPRQQIFTKSIQDEASTWGTTKMVLKSGFFQNFKN